MPEIEGDGDALGGVPPSRLEKNVKRFTDTTGDAPPYEKKRGNVLRN